MPRRPRILLADHPLHIFQRGINREPCFFADEDYLFYLHWLREGARKYGCAIHAYVLKTNHVHLLMTPSQPDSLARLMQSLGRRYAQYLNRTYRRSGSVWEGRYKSSLIQAEEYLLTCYRHIELNPLRADMVNDPSDYRWSSYRWHGLGLANDIISAHSLYHAMDADQAARCAEYRKLFRVELDTDAVAEIRASIQRCMPLGNETFRGQIETALGDRAGLKRRGRRPVTANEPIPGQLGLSL